MEKKKWDKPKVQLLATETLKEAVKTKETPKKEKVMKKLLRFGIFSLGVLVGCGVAIGGPLDDSILSAQNDEQGNTQRAKYEGARANTLLQEAPVSRQRICLPLFEVRCQKICGSASPVGPPWLVGWLCSPEGPCETCGYLP